MSAVLYPSSRVGVDAIAEHPDRIDVRSPAEFAEDHIPGARNHPVLDDNERARIGTMYADSPFEARRLGAALVARNIAQMLETAFAEQPREWKPLVYCWRGGQRSRAVAHVLNEVGWRAVQLDGGYRAYRRHVVGRLAVVPARYRFRVLCALTGSGKSQLLGALADAGAQTLDLERIAQHRGSLLGQVPGTLQPSQKKFESELLAALGLLDPRRPVYVEAESRRIGAVQLPDALLAGMHDGETIIVRTPLPQRIVLLKSEYGHFLQDPTLLLERLRPLVPLHGKAAFARWETLAAGGDWDTLIGDLLEAHYDPLYGRSMARHFPATSPRAIFALRDPSAQGFAALAADVLAASDDARTAVLEQR
ncbi:MAG TPA: tRNA 2-selenouridine(34) synthase MnmH [Casimicrobiaceae bacterium]|jgi:tRNA 2-selenouridine synthase|nr:tRNA 2-selenouridine(34) synthase MnmH [Casimicrobiaceae bacterium]